ncbi:DUF559 domain-containing protein [Amycolatopsis antarctica]|uniref:DUF559 domain-containing protein n=1 Tax=Amycolatopsis antarctica TaxID=1854586 RepID=UPI001F0A78B5|nr:DUF559 domain-containing protein [Amycolatopsis antarctica]
MTEIRTIPNGVCLRTSAAARLGRHRLRSALRHGELVPLWPRVVVARDRIADPKTLATSAILSIGRGAIIVRETAAFLHGCTSAEPTPVHVQVPYDRSPKRRNGIVVHQGSVEPEDVVVHEGVPLAALDLVLADLLCTGRPRRALGYLDHALRNRPVDERDELTAAVAARLAARADRRGTVNASILLGIADGRRESPAESSLCVIVHDAGFPPPESQYTIHNLDGRELYRLDFAWPELRIALEYDGYEAHEGRATQDAAREQDLTRRGWLVVRATATDLADPMRLVAELRRSFDQRLTGRA